MTDVDWGRYRKCPQCFALLGEPCTSLNGLVVGGSVIEMTINVRSAPHGGRKLRTGKPKTPVVLRDAISAGPRGTNPTGAPA